MKHILIPTDFSISSLKAIHGVVNAFPEGKLKITLLHLMHMPDDVTGLLTRRVQRRHQHEVDSHFKDACEVLKNKYSSRIEAIHIDFAYGSSVAYLKNYLEGIRVDVIFLLSGLHLKSYTEDSVPMLPMLKQTGWKIVELPGATKPLKEPVSSIADLLLAE